MYLKIIRRGLYNLRDSYLIYILSSSFAVAVLTLLTTLIQDPLLQTVHYWDQTLQSIMYAMVFVFAFFTFIYMIYVGGFFVKQQQQEFLTYRKLGMSRFVISVIGFGKTFVIQIFAWIVGMIVAVVLQKFIGMLLVYLMRIKLNFEFFFTWDIAWLILRVGIYSTLFLSLVNGVRSYYMVRTSKNHRKLHLNWFVKSVLGILGVLMFLSGLGLTISLFQSFTDTAKIDNALIRAFIIGVLYFFGTYFIYLGFLPLVLDICDRLKIFSYRGINLFSFKYLRARLIKNTSIVWFVTELSALAIALLVYCYAGYQVVYQNFVGAYPFELASIKQNAPAIQKELASKNVNVKMEYHSDIKRTVAYTFDYGNARYEPKLISFMSYSDYTKLPDRIKDHNPTITSNEFLELKYDMQSLTPGYRSTKYPVRIKDSQPIKDRKVGSFFPYGTGMFSGFMMIVPDNYFKTIKSESSDTFYGWDVKGSDKLSKNFIKQLDKKKNHYLLNVHVGSSLDDSYLTKQAAVPLNQLKVNDYLQAGYLRQADAKSIMRKATGLFLFLVSIFSVALLIALGSLLTLKVLLRDDYEWRQLKTLKKIGMTNQELKQIVKRETKFLFAIPMTFALIQSFLVVGVANLSVNQPTFIPFLLIGIAYLVLYGLVGFLTYILSWRGVRQKIN
ncbi:hypothetical protein [Companilactobacillus sp.]|uniref:hypothetical protein n=1 Tax=Companilactobacillus sp. TaxID=2767905 RepID=UPI0025BF0188|nr:hypothetical protein [Companilactobacillus sp.]MCH4008844.1 hypothetical protein [Companilactobacillus sp.]MCH4050977.1 hypothetical protein [Companilactobacillus sp.]MCH4076787.1 hypothetical protein [Companilactobacillus sp.]MCH4125362.1 hypothetical protein [Companilactobacillus sp.]MCH4131903.1 hypothetical protein [Companilactobacillus sp.]